MFSQIKKLFTHSLIYGVGYILTRVITFFLLPLYTNELSKEQYGIITLGFLFLGIFQIVYRYGMDTALMRYYEDEAYADVQKEVFSNTLFSVLATSFLLSFALFLVRKPVSEAVFVSAEYSQIIIYLAIILFCDTLSLLPKVILRIKERAVLFTGVSMVNVILTLSLNIYFIVYQREGVIGVFKANSIASASVLLVVSPILIRESAFSWSSVLWKKLFKFGVPLIPASLAAMILELADREILKQLTDMATVGLYSAGYKLGIFMMLVVSAFNFAWQPFYLKMGKTDDGPELFANVFTYFMLIMCTLFIVLTLFLHYIIRIPLFGGTILGPKFWSASAITPIIFVAYMFYGAYISFLPGPYLKNKTQKMVYFTGSGAIINVILNYALIPHFGIYGSAWATLFGYAVMAVLLYFYHQQLYFTPYQWNKLLKIFAITVVLTGVFYLWQPAIIGRILLLVAFPALVLGLRIIRIDQVQRVLRIFLRTSTR